MFEKRLAFWVIVATGLAVVIKGQNELSSLPIKYIESTRHGNLVMAKGAHLSSADTYHSLLTEKECTCQQACWTHPPCMAVSSMPHEGKILCRLSKKGPLASTLEINSEACYIFKTQTIESMLYQMKEDNLFYLIPVVKLPYEEAKAFCSLIPGHRLGIFHTDKQYKTLQKINNDIQEEIIIDLTYAEDGPMWGDGTLQSEVQSANLARVFNNDRGDPVGKIYRMKFGSLDDMAKFYDRHFVCQANPLGKEW